MENVKINQVVVKLASTCNLKCKYCYWFQTEDILKKQKVMSDELLESLVVRVKNHFVVNDRLCLVLHGGEPTLIGKKKMRKLLEELRLVADQTQLSLAITTNGMWLDEEWIHLFKKYDVSFTISLDGPELVHNKNRVDFQGRGTHDRVMKSIRLCQAQGVRVGSLMVLSDSVEVGARELLDFYVNSDISDIDFLIPDANYDSKSRLTFASKFSEVFKLWFNEYHQKLNVRVFESIIKACLGRAAKAEGIGPGYMSIVTVETDGGLKPFEVLLPSGQSSGFNILNNEFLDIRHDLQWQAILKGSTELSDECQQCVLNRVCGGGNIAHRYSSRNGYENPSVHCEELKELYVECFSVIKEQLFIK